MEKEFYKYLNEAESNYLANKTSAIPRFVFIEDNGDADILDYGHEDDEDKFLNRINTAKACFDDKDYNNAMNALRNAGNMIKSNRFRERFENTGIIELLDPPIRSARGIISRLSNSGKK